MSLIRLTRDRAEELATEHGTPYYVYDLAYVRAQYERLRAALPPVVDILYAVKANPHPAILETLTAAGAGLEVASQGELAAARTLGVEPRRLAFAGPAKRDVELRAALDLGLVLNVESMGELERADRIAGDLGGVSRPVSVRISPNWSVGEAVSIIGGAGASKFGVEDEQLDRFFALVARLEHVHVTGIHVFNATNVLDAGALAEGAGRVFTLAAELAAAGDVDLELIDIGGGLGIPYSDDQQALDLKRLGAGLDDAYRATFGDEGPRIIIEPGRFMVAESGTFVTRVVDRKTSRGTDFVLCDGGINHLLRPALIGQAHPMTVLGSTDDGDGTVFDVAGPLCTSLDVLAKGVRLNNPKPGDLIAIACAGAYGYTESMLDFLSHPRPAQVTLD